LASVAIPTATSSLLVPDCRVQAVPGGSIVRVMVSLLLGSAVLVAVMRAVPTVRLVTAPG
jgi:hypothetical protein